MEFHEVSKLFPLMTGAAFDELVADIKANGLREKIWTHDDQIIDGRNRFLACEKAGVDPEYREWDGDSDMTKFVVSLNLHRRHLNESQRGMIASKLATRPQGERNRDEQKADGSIELSAMRIDEAAELMNVSPATVKRAKQVRRNATPEVIAKVEAGEMSVTAAARAFVDNAPLEALKKARKSEASNPDTKTRKLGGGKKAPEAVRGAIGTLVGLATGLDSFTAKDAAPTTEEAAQWEKDLAIVISAINRFRRQLKEHCHVN